LERKLTLGRFHAVKYKENTLLTNDLALCYIKAMASNEVKAAERKLESGRRLQNRSLREILAMQDLQPFCGNEPRHNKAKYRQEAKDQRPILQ
jgi:hypothetical protein